jgi:hypothetical protein
MPARSAQTEEDILSTESIASPSSPATGVGESCAVCGAPLADDQRYCLECGERRSPISSVLLGGPPTRGEQQSSASVSPPSAPPAIPGQGGAGADGGRGGAVTVIAGVGVLLLAMGIGVLIGRSGDSKPAAAPAQVISVAQPGATTGAVTTPTPTPGASTKSGAPSSKQGAKKGASGVGSSESHPAPATVLKSLSKKKGKSYEQESKNLPNVISTG